MIKPNTEGIQKIYAFNSDPAWKQNSEQTTINWKKFNTQITYVTK